MNNSLKTMFEQICLHNQVISYLATSEDSYSDMKIYDVGEDYVMIRTKDDGEIEEEYIPFSAIQLVKIEKIQIRTKTKR